MKQQLMASVDVDVHAELRRRAEELDIPFSRVVNKLLRQALALPEADARPKPLSQRAQLVLEAVTALTGAAAKLDPLDPQWLFREFRMDQICRKVGDFPSKVLPALRECERAGVLICAQVVALGMDKDAPKLDHWRLPGE